MILEGYVSKIIYQNEDNSYTVFVVETADGDEVMVGQVPGIAEGMFIQAEGDYVHHPQYDLQFKITASELSMPSDTEGILRFLSSGIIKGVGEVLAKRIVKKFGEDTLRVMEEEPERLAEINGISERMAMKIAVCYNDNRTYRNVIIFLSQYGISVNQALKIYHEFGDGIYDTIRKNPYEIAGKVPGIGFKIVDRMAMQTGIAVDSEYRVEAAVIFSLNHAMLEGHLYLPEPILATDIFGLLDSEMSFEDFSERLSGILSKMELDKKVIIKEKDDSRIIYIRWNYFMELDSARRLLNLKFESEIDGHEVDEAISSIEEEMSIKLAAEQRIAVYNAVKSGVSIITGGPGTGKTTIINAIIRYFEYRADKVMLAAPTGRAAKRITESTGYKAKTIHRLLEFSGEPTEDGSRMGLRFQKNADNPLDADAIIIDEASMLDSSLFHSLLKAIVTGTRLILVGDTDQLPSVGAGNVLHDIIDSECFPITTLDQNFRQSGDSSIIENAHKIKKGVHLEISNASKDFFFMQMMNSREIAKECTVLVNHDLPKFLNVSPLDVEVLTPTRQYELGVEGLNKVLQKVINPASSKKKEKEKGSVIFREGDKVMQIRNNYKLEWKVFSGSTRSGILDQGVGVFNGDMGIISQINDFDERVVVTFDDGRVAEYEYSQLDELEHAFAITIHKSQGSEYPAVVIPLLGVPAKMMNRNLLYTAVTRAKNLVVIIGDSRIVNKMIDNVFEQERYTSFKDRIREFACESEQEEYMSLFDEDIEFEGLRDEDD